MSHASVQLLVTFDALPEKERDAVVEELILRRPVGGGDLADDDFAVLADNVFSRFDADEKTVPGV